MQTAARTRATTAGPSAPRPSAGAPSRPARLVVARSRDSGGGFASGFIVGGLVCGALGVLFAPQISRAVLDGEDRLRFGSGSGNDDPLDEEELGTTREALTAKISALNAAIDDVSTQLKSTQSAADAAEGTA